MITVQAHNNALNTAPVSLVVRADPESGSEQFGRIADAIQLRQRDRIRNFGYIEERNESNLGPFQITPVCSIPYRTSPIFYGNHLCQVIGL